jgi:hypothetical protein
MSARWLFAIGMLAFSAGCSSKDAALAPTSVTLTFPSTEAAVASDSVQIQVFDETAADPSNLSAACEDLVAQARSSQALPAPLVDVSTSACALQSGDDPVTVGVGVRAFLVTATSNGTALLIGCTVESVEGGSLLVPIDLVPLSDAVVVPPTTCTALSQHCSGGC